MKNPGLSLWGLTEYMDGQEQFSGGLFTTISLTERLDKDTCIDTILQLWGSNDVIRSNPYIMKRYTDLFFLKNYDNFDKMAEALQAEYDPIENYNRFEDTAEDRATAGSFSENGSDEGASSTTGSSGSEASSSGSGQTSGSAVNNTGASTLERKVSAMNSSTYAPRDEEISSARTDTNANTSASSENASSSVNASENQSSSFSNSDSKTGANTGTDNFTRDSHIHGNIGVTTSQQMIESEIELRKFNIYNYIADLYAKEFIYRIW